MLLPFTKEGKVLNEKPFIDYEVQFNLIHRIADDEGAFLLRSEDNSLIIAQSNIKFPMWVWVNPKAKINIQKVIKKVHEVFQKQESFKIVSTPEFMSLFFEKYKCQHRIEMEMESYQCKGVVNPKHTQGELTLPTMDNLETIAEFCVGFIYDGFGKNVSKESQMESGKRLIQSGNLYTLKVDDEIVSMANIAHRSPRHGRINNVYTPPTHRKKGYASKLVADLSKLILEEGLTPILFTDLSNQTSNKVYKDIGYTECGKVVNYEVKKH
ncbi:GNAT family N-acetyltransferase [Alkalicella caledoniensis]|uniref:GNAT family N-acetyltransferase n=1 Tax=Alkalicella caledoniensis TaxID=2731377 RepID=A0A7G9WAR4_ALKCA|nr:GNAT family N-acetyltransferase [Alkalicella caledoniensis]QNO15776.1 GNAT family N-acetyltransferase [Alkalicella caledoniensis]